MLYSYVFKLYVILVYCVMHMCLSDANKGYLLTYLLKGYLLTHLLNARYSEAHTHTYE